MKLLRSYDVVDIAPAAREEAQIFAAPQRCPNPVFGHFGLSSAFLPRGGAGPYRGENPVITLHQNLPSRRSRNIMP
jgi:hypothetical protein